MTQPLRTTTPAWRCGRDSLVCPILPEVQRIRVGRLLNRVSVRVATRPRSLFGNHSSRQPAMYRGLMGDSIDGSSGSRKSQHIMKEENFYDGISETVVVNSEDWLGQIRRLME